MFFQNGLNSINPVDLARVRRPGSQLKEALLPVPCSSPTSVSPTASALRWCFTGLQWRETVLEGCGTYFASNDLIQDGCSAWPGAVCCQPLMMRLVAPEGLMCISWRTTSHLTAVPVWGSSALAAAAAPARVRRAPLFMGYPFARPAGNRARRRLGACGGAGLDLESGGRATPGRFIGLPRDVALRS
ncbi:DUF1302 family protein [Pseudomonas parakoreensis]